MTVLTITSDSEEATELSLRIAEEHGLSVTTDEHRVLSHHDVLFGFGRPATDAELTEYFIATEEGDDIELIEGYRL